MSRVGQLLLDEGLVTEAQVGRAAELRRALGGTLGQSFVRIGAVGEWVLREVLCARLGLEAVESETLATVADEVAALLPADLAVDQRAVPVEARQGLLVLAMADPSDDAAVEQLSRGAGRPLVLVVATESDVTAALERLYGTADPKALPGRGHDPRWIEPVKVEPIELKPSRRAPLPDKRGAPDASGYRPPEPAAAEEARIREEALLDGPSEGFVALTAVKRRSTPPPAPVIEVRSVQVGPAPEVRGSRGGGEVAPVAPGHRSTVPAAGPPRRRALVSPSDSWEPHAPTPPPTVAPQRESGERPLEIADAVRALQSAVTRDGAIELGLSALLVACKRAAFFTVKRAVVEGFAAAGDGIDRDQVRSVWIPLASPCTLRDVCEFRAPRVGPVGDSRTDAIFTAALGGRRGDSVMVPVAAADRVVAVLYGDDLRGAAPSTSDLERLGAALGGAFARLAKGQRKETR